MIKKLLQTDPALPWRAHRYGCLWRAAIGIVETRMMAKGGSPLPGEALRELWDMHYLSAVNATAGLEYAHSWLTILADAYSMYSVKGGGNQVGRIIDGLISYWGPRPMDFDACTINRKTRQPEGHWLEGTQSLEDVWNPDPTVKIGERQDIFLVKLWEVS